MEYKLFYDNVQSDIYCNELDRMRQLQRLMKYAIILRWKNNEFLYGRNTKIHNEFGRLREFWDRESDLEKKVYGKMKNWEVRHPILGIIICTILGGILISLIAGIILEAVILAV